MTGYKLAGKKRGKSSKDYYPLSNTSRYLIHLTNLMWQALQAKGFKGRLYDRIAIQELVGFVKGDIKQREWIKHFAPSMDIKFNLEALQKHWPYPLLEIKSYLCFHAGNLKSMGVPAKLKNLALLETLYPGQHPGEYVALWENRFKGMPFYLKSDLTLAPHYDKKDPVATLWAWTATLLMEVRGREDRLKLCEFLISEGKPCLNLFWDESKNKIKKYCDEPACKRAQGNRKVANWRKRAKKEGWQKVSRRRARPT